MEYTNIEQIQETKLLGVLINNKLHLEQSCQVWHSSLTLENITDMERVQKKALKIILQEKYFSYANALEVLGLESLFDRRQSPCLPFAKKCTRSNNKQISSMSPLNKLKKSMTTRISCNYGKTSTKFVQRCVRLYKIKVSCANFQKLSNI